MKKELSFERLCVVPSGKIISRVAKKIFADAKVIVAAAKMILASVKIISRVTKKILADAKVRSVT